MPKNTSYVICILISLPHSIYQSVQNHKGARSKYIIINYENIGQTHTASKSNPLKYKIPIDNNIKDV